MTEAKYKVGDEVVFCKKFSDHKDKLIGLGFVEAINIRKGTIYYSIRYGKVIIRCTEDCVAFDRKFFD